MIKSPKHITKSLKKLAAAALAVLMMLQISDALIQQAAAASPPEIFAYVRTDPAAPAYDALAAHITFTEEAPGDFFTSAADVSSAERVKLSTGDADYVPVLAGLKFAYWADSSGTPVDFANFSFSSSVIEIYARYIPYTFDLRFDLNIASGEEASLVSGQYPDITGFSSETADLADFTRDPQTNEAADTTEPEYLAFAFFESTVNMDHSYDNANPFALPRRDDGTVFTGWYWDTNASQAAFTRDSHTTAIDCTKIPEDGIVTLYAGWNNGITIDFDMNDTSGAAIDATGYEPIIGLNPGWDILRSETAAWYNYIENGNPYKRVFGLLQDSLTDSLNGTSNYGCSAPVRNDGKVLIGWYTTPVTEHSPYNNTAVIAQPGYNASGNRTPASDQTLYALWKDLVTLHIDLNAPSGATVTNAAAYSDITGLLPYNFYGNEPRLDNFYDGTGAYSTPPTLSGSLRAFTGWKYYSDAGYQNEISRTSIANNVYPLGTTPDTDFYAVAQWGDTLAINIDLNLPAGMTATAKTLEVYTAPVEFLSGESADTGSNFYAFAYGELSSSKYSYKPQVEGHGAYFAGWTFYKSYDTQSGLYSDSYYQYSFYPMPSFSLYAVAQWNYPVVLRFDSNGGTGTFADTPNLQPVSDPYSYIDYDNGQGYSTVLSWVSGLLKDRKPTNGAKEFTGWWLNPEADKHFWQPTGGFYISSSGGMTTGGAAGPNTGSIYTRDSDGHYQHNYQSYSSLPNYTFDAVNKVWVLTLYAGWSDTYTIDFDLNTPAGHTESEITNKSNIVPITGLYYGEWLSHNTTFNTAVYTHSGGFGQYFGTYKPSLEGYRFLGWSWQSTGYTDANYYYYSYTGQPKMYAVWEKIGYVYFHANVPDGYGYTNTPAVIPEAEYQAVTGSPFPSYGKPRAPKFSADPYNYTAADLTTPLISAGGYNDLLMQPIEFDSNQSGLQGALYDALKGSKQYKGKLGDLVLEGWFLSSSSSVSAGAWIQDTPDSGHYEFQWRYEYTYHSDEMQDGMYSDQKKEGEPFGSGWVYTLKNYAKQDADGAWNIHLYAHYMPQPYLYFEDNLPPGASTAGYIPTNTFDAVNDHRLALTAGSPFSAAPGFDKVKNPVLPGYVFVRWLMPNDSYFYASNTATGDTTVHAQWAEAALLTLDMNVPAEADGSTLVPMPVTSFTVGKGVSFSDGAPTLQMTLQSKWPKLGGYGFIGWYYDDGTPFSVYDTCTQNTTIYAKWGKLVDVTFDMNLGGVTDPTLVPTSKTTVKAVAGTHATSTEYGNNADIYSVLNDSSRPSREAFDFDGWLTDRNDENSQISVWSWIVPEDGAALYVKWAPALYMYFDPNVDASDPLQPVPNTPYAARVSASNGYRDGYYRVFETNRDTLPFTREGAVITGWYNDAALTSPFYAPRSDGGIDYWSDYWNTMNADKTIYAKWETAYTLKLNSNTNDPTVFEAHPPEIKAGAGYRWSSAGAARNLVEPERKEYFFTGWYTDPACTAPFDWDSIALADLEVYAKWEKLGKLTLDLNTTDPKARFGGANVIYLRTGDTYSQVSEQIRSAKPTRPGYSFAGYYLDMGCASPFDMYAPADAERTVYAKWVDEIYLTLDANAGTDTVTGDLPGPYLLLYGKGLAYDQEDFTYYNPFDSISLWRDGYTFTGKWHVDSPSGPLWNYDYAGYTDATANITLYAEWEAGEYKITLDKNNTDAGSTNSDPEEVQFALIDGYLSFKISPAAVKKPTRAGYRFTGWYTDPGAADYFKSGDWYSDPALIPPVLYAGWEPFAGQITEPDFVTVTFDANAGGDAVANLAAPVKVKPGTRSWDAYSVTSVLYDYSLTRENYAFIGWGTSPGGGDWYNWFYSHSEFSEDVTFYAQWVPSDIKLTFDINIPAAELDGRVIYPSPTELFAKQGYSISVQSPTRPGYEFVDWYLEPAGINRWNGYVPAQSATYYALWRPVNGLDPLQVIYFEQNLDVLTYELIAAAEKHFHTIAEGELAGNTMYTPENGEREFLGWYLHTEFSAQGYSEQRYAYTDSGTKITPETPLTTAMAALERTIILFAHWSDMSDPLPEAAKGKISYNANYPNGNSPAPFESEHEYGVIPLKSAEELGYGAEGFTFLGWYTEAVNGDKVTAVTLSAGSPKAAVYAHWRSDTFRVFTSEHVKYVSGYPDGTVRPQGSITRAEVAAILYSVLMPDMKAMYETTSNPFTDVPAGDWYAKAVLTIANLGIMNGYPDGTFGPGRPITRAEVASMAGNSRGLVTLLNAPELERNKDLRFPDVAEGQWYTSSVYRAVRAGYFYGDEQGNFRPGSSMTRAEFMTFMNRVLERLAESHSDMLPGMKTFPDNADTSAWYYREIQEATNGHEYARKENGNPRYSFKYEKWIKLT
jgi:uncharacterized repeat protein (TIGR02543 family)